MSFDPKAIGNKVVEQSRCHLHDVHETYWEHMKFAVYAVWMMLSAAILLIIHLIVPAWFQTSASERIFKLAGDMQKRRDRMGCAE